MSPATNGAIEEIVARCLVEPAFLDAVCADTDRALVAYPLNVRDRATFRTADLTRLRQFSGFIGKIQHNFLWESFPETLKLLRREGIELEVFTRHRYLQLSPELRRAPQNEKIRCFLTFLESYLIECACYPSLHAVMRHERAVWEVRQTVTTPAPGRLYLQPASFSTLSWGRFSRLVPSINGSLRIEVFDCDPIALITHVMRDPVECRTNRHAKLLVYWADPSTAQLRTFAVEPLSAAILSQTDGFRCVRSVVAAVRRQTLAGAPPRAFRSFFERAACAGLISLAVKER